MGAEVTGTGVWQVGAATQVANESLILFRVPLLSFRQKCLKPFGVREGEKRMHPVTFAVEYYSLLHRESDDPRIQTCSK